MQILALSGWKGSGKDTCADYLVSRYGYKRLSFADKMKDDAAVKWNVPREWFDDRTMKEKALPQYPALVEDAWATTVMPMLFGHLRSIDNERAQSYDIFAGKVIGIFYIDAESGEQGLTIERRPLYHTPRSIAVNEGLSARVVDPEIWVRKAFESCKPGDKLVISDLRLKSEARCLKKLGAKLVRLLRFDSSPETDASERDLDDYPFDEYVQNRGTVEELMERCDQLGAAHT
jgi:hypothetical protein